MVGTVHSMAASMASRKSGEKSSPPLHICVELVATANALKRWAQAYDLILRAGTCSVAPGHTTMPPEDRTKTP